MERAAQYFLLGIVDAGLSGLASTQKTERPDFITSIIHHKVMGNSALPQRVRALTATLRRKSRSKMPCLHILRSLIATLISLQD